MNSHLEALIHSDTRRWDLLDERNKEVVGACLEEMGLTDPGGPRFKSNGMWVDYPGEVRVALDGGGGRLNTLVLVAWVTDSRIVTTKFVEVLLTPGRRPERRIWDPISMHLRMYGNVL